MTIQDVIDRLPVGGSCLDLSLPVPLYDNNGLAQCVNPRVGLAVESMRRHTSDEGWQLFDGLQQGDGWALAGWNLPTVLPGTDEGRDTHPMNLTDVNDVLDVAQPGTLLIQDKREWIGKTAGPGFDAREQFTNVKALRDRLDVFKLTVIKDAQNDGALHVDAAEEIGCHAWVCYYHPKIVKRLAPFVREEHLVRTWHSVDKNLVPKFDPVVSRSRAVLSGAMSKAYPLRQRCLQIGEPHLTRLPHPGYSRDGCYTPTFLSELSRFKVAICTCSVYGYALRKLIEATACGCRVITNLPEDEVLPLIDDNLVRVPDDISMDRLRLLLQHHVERWDAGFQEEMARRACAWYDFRATGKRLSDDIEALRRRYVEPT